MFNNLDLEHRKNYTNSIIQTYIRLLKNITNNQTFNVNITTFFHILIVILPSYLLIVKPVHTIYFYISLVIWVLIILSNLYFNGCIFIRIEQELISDKTWKGPWVYLFSLLKLFNINVTPTISTYIFISGGILFLTLLLFKIYKYPSLGLTLTNHINLNIERYLIIFILLILYIAFNPNIYTYLKNLLEKTIRKN